MKTILEKADFHYWNGQPTGINDAVYDKLSAESGHICQPPATLKGWAKYPDYCLAIPNFGLKKVSYEIAKQAVKWFPKWDGIFIQVFQDENGLHTVTRGDGRIGKDIAQVFPRNYFDEIPTRSGVNYYLNKGNFELVYSVADGGRAALCRDLSKGIIKRYEFILHDLLEHKGTPPQMIPEHWAGYPIDGYVIELASGEKFKYKG